MSDNTASAVSALSKLVDSRNLLSLQPYDGSRESFADWKWQFYVALSAIKKPLKVALKNVEGRLNEDWSLNRLTDDEKAISEELYTILALTCKGESQQYIRAAEDSNGHAAWQALLRARLPRNASTLLARLLEPKFASEDPRINLRLWEKGVREYESLTGERISNGIRRSVYLNKIAPPEMRQHLMLNQARLEDHITLAQEIEEYTDVREEFAYQGNTSMVAVVDKGSNAKGGKDHPKGKGDKGKMHKGLGYHPREGEQRRFGGHCNWCWRIGHKADKCWFRMEWMKQNPEHPLTKEYEKGSGGRGKGSKSKGKGDKGKGGKAKTLRGRNKETHQV